MIIDSKMYDSRFVIAVFVGNINTVKLDRKPSELQEGQFFVTYDTQCREIMADEVLKASFNFRKTNALRIAVVQRTAFNINKLRHIKNKFLMCLNYDCIEFAEVKDEFGNSMTATIITPGSFRFGLVSKEIISTLALLVEEKEVHDILIKTTGSSEFINLLINNYVSRGKSMYAYMAIWLTMVCVMRLENNSMPHLTGPAETAKALLKKNIATIFLRQLTPENKAKFFSLFVGNDTCITEVFESLR